MITKPVCVFCNRRVVVPLLAEIGLSLVNAHPSSFPGVAGVERSSLTTRVMKSPPVLRLENPSGILYASANPKNAQHIYLAQLEQKRAYFMWKAYEDQNAIKVLLVERGDEGWTARELPGMPEEIVKASAVAQALEACMVEL